MKIRIFAYYYCGKLWYVSGIISLIIRAMVMVLVMGQTENMIGAMIGVILMITTVCVKKNMLGNLE